MGDVGRDDRLAAERDALVEQLTTAFGLGGRARRAGSPAERARTTATARIRHAIRRIEAVASRSSVVTWTARVRTGTFCVYQPDPAGRLEGVRPDLTRADRSHASRVSTHRR